MLDSKRSAFAIGTIVGVIAGLWIGFYGDQFLRPGSDSNTQDVSQLETSATDLQPSKEPADSGIVATPHSGDHPIPESSISTEETDAPAPPPRVQLDTSELPVGMTIAPPEELAQYDELFDDGSRKELARALGERFTSPIDPEQVAENVEAWSDLSESDRVSTALRIHADPVLARKFSEKLPLLIAEVESAAELNALLLAMSTAEVPGTFEYSEFRNRILEIGTGSSEFAWPLLVNLIAERETLAADLAPIIESIQDDDARAYDYYSAWARAMREAGPEASIEAVKWLTNSYMGASTVDKKKASVGALMRMNTPEAVDATVELYYGEADPELRKKLVVSVIFATGFTGPGRAPGFWQRCIDFIAYCGKYDPDPEVRKHVQQRFPRAFE